LKRTSKNLIEVFIAVREEDGMFENLLDSVGIVSVVIARGCSARRRQVPSVASAVATTPSSGTSRPACDWRLVGRGR
jgi:hypothetical protein